MTMIGLSRECTYNRENSEITLVLNFMLISFVIIVVNRFETRRYFQLRSTILTLINIVCSHGWVSTGNHWRLDRNSAFNWDQIKGWRVPINCGQLPIIVYNDQTPTWKINKWIYFLYLAYWINRCFFYLMKRVRFISFYLSMEMSNIR